LKICWKQGQKVNLRSVLLLCNIFEKMKEIIWEYLIKGISKTEKETGDASELLNIIFTVPLVMRMYVAVDRKFSRMINSYLSTVYNKS
jgi:hypothetical protein